MPLFTRHLVLAFAATSLWSCGDPAEFPALGESQHTIIGGERSGRADFPSTGAVIMALDIDGRRPVSPVCSGTLIAPDVVLTAAHCVNDGDLDARQDSAEDFSRLNALLFTATPAWIFIPAYCFANP